MDIWICISVIIGIGFIGAGYLVFKLEKEKNFLEDRIEEKNKHFALCQEETGDLLKECLALKKKCEELKEQSENIIKPTIYIEKPKVETLELKMALPYYDEEDKETVMEQVKNLIAEHFTRDMFEYIDWIETKDFYDGEQKIMARLRVIKPMR